MDAFRSADNLEREGGIHYDLHRIFEGACSLTAPFFDASLGPGGYMLPASAHRRLHERYPDLTHQEVAILLSVVRRFHTGQYSG